MQNASLLRSFLLGTLPKKRATRSRRKLQCHNRSESLEEEVARLRHENIELKQRIAKLSSKAPAKEKKIPPAPVIEADDDGIHWPSPNESPPFWTRPPRNDTTTKPSGFNGNQIVVSEEPDAKKLYIVHMTAEMAPIAKVGCSVFRRSDEKSGRWIGRRCNGIVQSFIGSRAYGGSLFAVLSMSTKRSDSKFGRRNDV